MRQLPDGTYEIKNKTTGETKIVPEGDLSKYGLTPQKQGFMDSLLSTTRKIGQPVQEFLQKPTITGKPAELVTGLEKATSSALKSAPVRETAGAFMRGNLAGETANVPEILPAPETPVGKTIQAAGGVVGFFNPESIIGKTMAKTIGGAEKVAKTIPVVSQVLTGAEKAAQEAATGGKNLISKIAKSMYSSNFTIPSKLAGRIGIDDVAKKMIENGHVGGLEDLSNIASQVTGRDGIFPKINREALGLVKQEIPFGNAVEAGNKAIDAIPELQSKLGEANKHKEIIRSLIKPEGSLGKTTATNAFDAIQELEKRGYQYINSSTKLTPNLVNEEIGKAYLSAADELKTVIDKSYGDKNILDLLKTPENLQAITEISPKLAEDFMNAKTMADLRKIQSPYVRLQQAIDLTQNAARTPFSQMGKAAATGAGTAAGAAVGGWPGAVGGAMLGGAAAPIITPILESVIPPVTTAAAKELTNNRILKMIKPTIVGATKTYIGSKEDQSKQK